jgi:hypothetical protein
LGQIRAIHTERVSQRVTRSFSRIIIVLFCLFGKHKIEVTFVASEKGLSRREGCSRCNHTVSEELWFSAQNRKVEIK